MLVLTRTKGEQIRISDDILITVCDIDRGKVRIGITAAKKIPVYREEVYKLRQLRKEEGDEANPVG